MEVKPFDENDTLLTSLVVLFFRDAVCTYFGKVPSLLAKQPSHKHVVKL